MIGVVADSDFENRFRYYETIEGLLENFKKKNSLEDTKKNFFHLAFGKEPFVERLYDCINDTDYRLPEWGESCTLELFGWINQDGAPPFNGRIIKGLRYLGFDVDIKF